MLDATSYYERTTKALEAAVSERDGRLLAARTAEDLRAARAGLFAELDGIQRMVVASAPCHASKALGLKACTAWRRQAEILADSREKTFFQIAGAVGHA